MSFGVIQFPGSNCDHDCYYVPKELLHTNTFFIWHDDQEIPPTFFNKPQTHTIIIPGGFSYGDYLRCGAIAKFARITPQLKKFAAAGGRVIGICNGFQILLEIGLLPGALHRNKNLKFICKTIHLKTHNNKTPFTKMMNAGEVITIPIAHGEGNYYCTQEQLADLKKNNQIVFTYCDEKGVESDEANPNGSLAHIAGICNKEGNVLGMMPHPERCSEKVLGSTDGFKIFSSLMLL